MTKTTKKKKVSKTTRPKNQLKQVPISDSKIVFATGCLNSGWNIVIPILQQGGLNLVNEDFSTWYTELFQKIENYPNEIEQPVQPGDDFVKIATNLLTEDKASPSLLADSRNLWLLNYWAENFPQAHFLLFYTKPDIALAHAFQDDIENPIHYLDVWRDANREIIRFQSRHRNRAILFNAEDVTRDPQGFIDACLRINLRLEAPQQSQNPAPFPPLLEHLLANHLVTGHPVAQSLQTELAARALPLNDHEAPNRLQSTDLITSYVQHKTTEQALQEQLTKTKDELSKLATDRKKTVENLTAELGNAKKDNETLRVKLDQSQQENKKIQGYQDDVDKENELLLLQLHQVQEELEQYFLKTQELELAQQKILEPEEIAIETDNEDTVEAKPSLITKLFASISIPTNPAKAQKKQLKIIEKSGLFDKTWYLSQHPDVAKEKFDPIVHYILHGVKERRNPSPNFDTHAYLVCNPDLAETDMNPLIHYIKYAKSSRN